MSLPAAIDYVAPVADLPENRAEWRLEPQRAAVLVHDLQRYFVRPFADDCPALRSAVDATAAIVAAARAAGAPVFYTAQRGDQDPVERGLQGDLWGPGMRATPEHTDIMAEIAPGEGDVVLTKHRYSAFARSDLAERMAAAGRDQLIVTGVYAHIGVTATAMEAFQREIHPFVVADGVADFGEEQHRRALAQVAGCCGVVLLASEVLEALGDGRSGEGSRGDAAQVPGDAVVEGLRGLLSDEQLAAAIAAPEADLFELGLDSLRAFELVDRLADDGIDVDFGDFVRSSSLNWLRRQSAVPVA